MENFNYRKLIFILLCLVSTLSYGKVYYVALHGNDNNTGDINSPYATLNYAADIAIDYGDIIYVMDGTYTIDSQISLSSGVNIEGTRNLPTFNCTYNGTCLYLNSPEGTNSNQSISYCKFVGS